MNWASRLTGRLSFSISMVPRSAAFVNGVGKVLTAPAHGLRGSAGGGPLSHGYRRASSPKGGAKPRLPLWGRCPRRGRRGQGATVREKRFAVSLAFFLAAAYKGKVVGRCPTPRNPLKRVDLNFT